MRIVAAGRSLRTVVCCVVLLAIVALGMGADPAYADFAVYPSRVEVAAEAGQTIEFEITATTADAPNPMQVVVSAWDFARDSTGEPRPIAAEDAERFRGCSSWLDWEPGNTLLGSGDEFTFAFTAEVPEDAEDGTHYCYVTFSGMPQVPPAAATESGQAMRTPLGFAVSALVLVSVGDPDAGPPVLRANARVSDFGVRLVNLDTEIPMEVTLVNSGNIHLNMAESSKIEITKGKYTEADIGVKPYTLLPENTLVIPAVWTPDTVGIYRAVFYTDVGLGEPITAERTFLVVSWPLMIAIIAILILLALAAWLFFGRYRIRLQRTDASA